jgi:hypothetical protein
MSAAGRPSFQSEGGATPPRRATADIQPSAPAPFHRHKAPNRAVCPARRCPGYPAVRRVYRYPDIRSVTGKRQEISDPVHPHSLDPVRISLCVGRRRARSESKFLRALQFVGRVERGATRRRFRGKHGGLHPPYALVKRSRSRLRHHPVDQGGVRARAEHVLHPISHRPREISAEPSVRLENGVSGPRLPKVGPGIDADHAGRNRPFRVRPI